MSQQAFTEFRGNCCDVASPVFAPKCALSDLRRYPVANPPRVLNFRNIQCRLESGNLLPPGIRAKPLVADRPLQVLGQDIQPDAILDSAAHRPGTATIPAV